VAANPVFLKLPILARILGRRVRTRAPSALQQNSQLMQGDAMKKSLALILLASVLFAAPALAADPIVGTWKLNVAKSKFASGGALTTGTRTYTESKGLYTLKQSLTGTDGKARSNTATYQDGVEVKQSADGPYDATLAKKIDANTWDFDLKKGGKVVGHVHRVVSADGKTLTVQNSGNPMMSGGSGDETLVFDRQ
jgi:hypothetical protein